jgi:hypothetical protein
MNEIADEIQNEVLPALQRAIVTAEVRGDYGPHLAVQKQLLDIAQRLRNHTERGLIGKGANDG